MAALRFGDRVPTLGLYLKSQWTSFPGFLPESPLNIILKEISDGGLRPKPYVFIFPHSALVDRKDTVYY